MSKMKSYCPLCEKEIKEGERCRFRWNGQDYIVHEKCAHPKNEQLERVERMLKWLIVEKMMTEEIWRRMGEPQLKTPDILDILDKEE